MHPASLKPIPLGDSDDRSIARLCLLTDEHGQPTHARHRPGEIALLGAITDHTLRIREYITIVGPSDQDPPTWASSLAARPSPLDRWPVPERLRAESIKATGLAKPPLPRGISRIEPAAPITLEHYTEALASEASDRLRDDLAATLARWSLPSSDGPIPTFTATMPAPARAPESLQLACHILQDVLAQIEHDQQHAIPLSPSEIGVAPTQPGLAPTLWSVRPVLPGPPIGWTLTSHDGTTWIRVPRDDASLSVDLRANATAVLRGGQHSRAYTVTLPEPVLLTPGESGEYGAEALDGSLPKSAMYECVEAAAWSPVNERSSAQAAGELILSVLDRLGPALAGAVSDEYLAARELASGLRDGMMPIARARAGLGAIAQRCGWTWAADPVSCAELRDVLTGLLEERG